MTPTWGVKNYVFAAGGDTYFSPDQPFFGAPASCKIKNNKLKKGASIYIQQKKNPVCRKTLIYAFFLHLFCILYDIVAHLAPKPLIQNLKKGENCFEKGGKMAFFYLGPFFRHHLNAKNCIFHVRFFYFFALNGPLLVLHIPLSRRPIIFHFSNSIKRDDGDVHLPPLKHTQKGLNDLGIEFAS
jgi:hypothetical protein